MQRVIVRPLSADDAGPLEELCVRELLRDPYAAEIPRLVTRLPHIGLAAQVDGELAGACVGSVSRHGNRGDAHLDLIVVAPTRRRSGVARTLLAELEARLLRDGCTRLRIEGNAPSYAWSGVDVHYTPALCFVERAGFRRGLCAVNMTVELTADVLDTAADEARLDTCGVAIRRATEADTPSVQALSSRWRKRWVEQLCLALRDPRGAVFLAEAEGQCVGFCAYGVNRRHELGPLGVDEEVRRLGIGAALLKRCCARQRQQGLQRAELQWAGPLPYFADVLNAQISRVFWLYSKDLVKPPGLDRTITAV
jgi:mycothiol synthase